MLFWTRPFIEKVLAFDRLNDCYSRIGTLEDERIFAEKALEILDVNCNVTPEDLAKVPVDRPLVIVSNHPFGGLEGLILEAKIRHVRPDVKLLANYLLQLIPDMQESLFPVDPFERPESVKRNIVTVKRAVKWVCDGHALIVFPAGEVSHLMLRKRRISDKSWNPTAARIAKLSSATILPVCFEGSNSRIFQLMGLMHPGLRTIMLPRELLKKRSTDIRLHIGSPIEPQKYSRFDSSDDLCDYLRVRTYILKNRSSSSIASKTPPISHKFEPIIPPQPREKQVDEIYQLPPQQHILRNSSFDVYIFDAGQCPVLMQEIGRLREITFRKIEEGTGRAVDLDRFDEYYKHIIVWDSDRQQLVGAYRAGETDKILPMFGKRGLYTNTLFKFKRRLLDQISPGLEMGRSFIQPDYQRHHSPLMLLWKGIGRYVAKNPQYKHLFGPVSISNAYHSSSKLLLMKFLNQNHSLPAPAQFIKPTTPPRYRPFRDWSARGTSLVIQNLDEVNTLIGEIDRELKGIPVLLRQYLKLNAVLLGFNVDPKFGDVLDALMLVDLTKINKTVLKRYMGTEGATNFLAHHRKPGS